MTINLRSFIQKITQIERMHDFMGNFNVTTCRCKNESVGNVDRYRCSNAAHAMMNNRDMINHKLMPLSVVKQKIVKLRPHRRFVNELKATCTRFAKLYHGDIDTRGKKLRRVALTLTQLSCFYDDRYKRYLQRNLYIRTAISVDFYFVI